MNHLFFKNQNNESGMTFIEIIVVMGIFATISATVLFNYRDFSNGVKLQNLSQEIALQGKRAQTLASQGRRPVLTDAQMTNGLVDFLPPEWVSSYGLAFDIASDPKSFIFYFNSPAYYLTQDLNGDSEEYNSEEKNLSFYDFAESTYIGCGSATSECVEEINITDASFIELICVNEEPPVSSGCLDPDNTVNKLYVSFTRPFLEAYILDENLIPVSNAFIKVSSGDGTQKRYVSFWSTGQIGVN